MNSTVSDGIDNSLLHNEDCHFMTHLVYSCSQSASGEALESIPENPDASSSTLEQALKYCQQNIKPQVLIITLALSWHACDILITV